MAKHHQLHFSDSIRVSEEISARRNDVLIELGPAIGRSGGSLELAVGAKLDEPQVAGTKPVLKTAPRVEVTFPKTQWLIATTGFGSLVGGFFEGHLGTLVGGLAGYFWGRWRWSQANR